MQNNYIFNTTPGALSWQVLIALGMRPFQLDCLWSQLYIKCLIRFVSLTLTKRDFTKRRKHSK